jgi:ABC-type Fe3+/spermidine/putrescine transport system ATPase subunit
VSDLAGAGRGQRVRVSVRPEDIRLLNRPPTEGDAALRGRVLVKTFMGAVTRLDVQCEGLRFRVDAPSSEASKVSGQQEVWLLLPERCRIVEVLDREGTSVGH